MILEKQKKIKRFCAIGITIYFYIVLDKKKFEMINFKR